MIKRVRWDLKLRFYNGLHTTPNMLLLRGKKVHITNSFTSPVLGGRVYLIEEDQGQYYWDEKMFSDLNFIKLHSLYAETVY